MWSETCKMFLFILFVVTGVLYTSATDTVSTAGKGHIIVKHACEHDKHDTITLSCSRGGTIHIWYAMYGRLETNVCPDSATTNCRSASSLSATNRLCEGRNSCQVSARNSVFGEPCQGVGKYLEVVYELNTIIEVYPGK
ncbi:L-rhamnose-binding lectin ELEL-1-like [Ptychodera flava]|uniref:L-rhamnose-binding lectin ELEL-1-like n=1 Tax=Ptychodera flava TaxID=63121 RepID=UPI00396A676E